MAILDWLKSKNDPKHDATSHYNKNVEFEKKRLSGSISSDDASSVYEDSVEEQHKPYRGEPLRKVDFSSEKYGGFNTKSGHDEVEKTLGSTVLSRKAFLRDNETGAAMGVVDNGLRTRINYTEKDDKGEDRQVRRETKVGGFKKKVDYQVDQEKGENKLEKEITRGGRAASLTWTKKADGTRSLNGFTLGPLAFRYKQFDGSTHLKMQVGKAYSFERFTDKEGLTSTKKHFGKGYSHQKLTDNKGETLESIKWSRGKTKVLSKEDNGSLAKYTQRGKKTDVLTMDQVESAIDTKENGIKVKRLIKRGYDGEIDRKFEQSKYSLRKNDFQRGKEGANDVTTSRNRLGVQTRRETPGEDTLRSLQMQGTPGSFPSEKAVTPGENSKFQAKLVKLQKAHATDRDRSAIRLR